MKKILNLGVLFSIVLFSYCVTSNTSEKDLPDALKDILVEALNSENLSEISKNHNSFVINDDKITVLDSIYFFDRIKYLDSYFCIYLKDGQYNLVSHLGKNLHLHDFKADTIKTINGEIESILYNQNCELFIGLDPTGARSARNKYIRFQVYKFNETRTQVIEGLGEGKYVGRGWMTNTTNIKVWKEHLSMERNMQLYGMNAWKKNVKRTQSESVKKLVEINARIVTPARYNISAKLIDSSHPDYVTDEASYSEEKNYHGYVNVENLNFRRTAEIKDDNIIRKLFNRQKVVVLSTTQSNTNSLKGLLRKETIVEYNGRELKLQPGKALDIISKIDKLDNNRRTIGISYYCKAILNSNDFIKFHIDSHLLEVISIEDWSKIEIEDGTVGYVYSRFITNTTIN